MSDLARSVVVVVLGGGRGSRLYPLTHARSKPAVPIAGKYRLIDVPISNAIHSGMQRILVLTQFNSVSLHRHIALTYKFDPFSPGYVQILAAQQTPSSESWFQGTADAVRQNLELVGGLAGDLALILSGDHMYRMDYRAMLRDHVERQADVTIGVVPCSENEIAELGAVRIDADGRILEFREKPATPEARAGMKASERLLAERGVSTDRPYLASMGIYLFRKDVLAPALDNTMPDFGRDIIPGCVGRLRVQAFLFGGYWRDIGTMRSFYETHMDLVRDDPPFDVQDRDWPVFTRPRFLPPARIDGCNVTRTLMAEGARLSDSTFEDTVIGIGSEIRGATIRRSMILGIDANRPPLPGDPPPGIGPGTVIENAIVDKNARIGRDVRILNQGAVREAEGPGWVIRDGLVVVQRRGVVPDGTVI